MARPCLLCEHARRREIEAAIIAGRSLRSLSAQYGIAYGAIFRHRHNHLPQSIRAAAAEVIQCADAIEPASTTGRMPVASHGAANGLSDEPSQRAPRADSEEVSNPGMRPVPVRSRNRIRNMQLTDSPPVSAAPTSPAPQSGNTAPSSAGAFNLYESATDLRDRAMAILAAAERDRDAKVALLAIREARGVLEHLNRLEERNHIAGPTVPLVESEEWHRVRAAVITALADHPEARLAVAEALIATGALQ